MLPGAIKRDPLRRWQLSDRVFFGHGACHILAGVFLADHRRPELHAYWICPTGGLPGFHIFVSDGLHAFDYHGYSSHQALVRQHQKGWRRQHPEWRAGVTRVDFDLLSTEALNAHRMLGPDQYFQDPRPRAREFIQRFANYRPAHWVA